jgi:hypothetical protein
MRSYGIRVLVAALVVAAAVVFFLDREDVSPVEAEARALGSDADVTPADGPYVESTESSSVAVTTIQFPDPSEARSTSSTNQVMIRLPDGSMVSTSMSGDIELPPGGVLDLEPIPQPAYRDPLRDGRIDTEPVDRDWATQMESTLWSVASAVGEIRDVECRTTFCLATLVHGDDVKAMELEARRPYLQGRARFVEETMRYVIRNSNGRLEYFGFSTIGAPHEDYEMQFYLYGPPIESERER